LFPAHAGPVPPDARTWTVGVVNKSSEPATLFVSEETKTGTLGRLVGSVTPNVVPPRATAEGTFRLRAKGRDWAIFGSARPDDGGLVGSRDVPLPGYIY